MTNAVKRGISLAALLALIFVSAALPGCAQRNLFADDDPAVHKKKYWDDESVRQSHEVRDQTKGAGFGMANGPGLQ